jgi:hypothetical protein
MPTTTAVGRTLTLWKQNISLHCDPKILDSLSTCGMYIDDCACRVELHFQAVSQ